MCDNTVCSGEGHRDKADERGWKKGPDFGHCWIEDKINPLSGARRQITGREHGVSKGQI